MKEFFERFVFYQIDACSLFSKWFSESSHNLSRMFDEIVELADNGTQLIFVLIDEIESLSMCRSRLSSSNEPSDFYRVVNTLLTEIDRLKHHSNVVLLTTSNHVELIDRAMVDRSDLILFIGPPSTRTRQNIYLNCFQELLDKNLVDRSSFDKARFHDDLSRLVQLSQGLSGRTIRKLPLLAFTRVEQIRRSISFDDLFRSIFSLIEQQKEIQRVDDR